MPGHLQSPGIFPQENWSPLAIGSGNIAPDLAALTSRYPDRYDRY
ncbi:hypothetical protein [Tychonema sp. LEGE 07203]|nr:hypothetical protein [Tychonema sp. LEGE 07203]